MLQSKRMPLSAKIFTQLSNTEIKQMNKMKLKWIHSGRLHFPLFTFSRFMTIRFPSCFFFHFFRTNFCTAKAPRQLNSNWFSIAKFIFPDFSVSFLVHSFNVICQWYWCKSSGRLYWQHCIRTEIEYILFHKIVSLEHWRLVSNGVIQ